MAILTYRLKTIFTVKSFSWKHSMFLGTACALQRLHPSQHCDALSNTFATPLVSCRNPLYCTRQFPVVFLRLYNSPKRCHGSHLCNFSGEVTATPPCCEGSRPAECLSTDERGQIYPELTAFSSPDKWDRNNSFSTTNAEMVVVLVGSHDIIPPVCSFLTPSVKTWVSLAGVMPCQGGNKN